ncbi:MAG: invasion associated locus B family protein [Sphingomonadales bacterium]
MTPSPTRQTVRRLLIAGAALAALAPASVPAQAPAPTKPQAPGAPSVQQAYGAWTLICAPARTGGEVCEVQQAALNDKGQTVAVAALMRKGSELDLRIDLPIGVYLRKNPVLQVDKGAARDGLSYLRCTPRVCIARMTITASLLDALRRGGELAVTFNRSSRQTASATFSLKGFPDAEKAFAARAR